MQNGRRSPKGRHWGLMGDSDMHAELQGLRGYRQGELEEQGACCCWERGWINICICSTGQVGPDAAVEELMLKAGVPER
jgi:hypothetical protein